MEKLNSQPKTADRSTESLIFGIYDRLTDHGRSTVNVVVAPADADGNPDWDAADPTNLESLPFDEWPQDPAHAARVAVLVDDLDGCDPATSMLVFIRADGNPSIQQVAGPGADADIAQRMIGRDIGAKPSGRAPTPLAESLAQLTADLFPPKPVAANDNKPMEDDEPDISPQIAARIARLQKAHGGTVRDGTVVGASFNGMLGQIFINAKNEAVFLSAKTAVLLPETTPLAATRFALGDPKAIPVREWLFGSHYMRKFLTVTVGAGGGGKSANTISEVLAMVTGRPLLDPDGPMGRKLRVWYVNAEDPRDEIERRFAGAALHFNVTNDQIGDRLFTDSGREQEFVIVRQVGRDFKVCEPMVDDMLASIRENKIDVVIVDPFVSTHEVPENDNGLIQRVAKAWRRVADEGNCSVELIHHTTKGNFEVTADSARGGGALKDAARSLRTINPMSKEEAERAGLPSAAGHFRLDFGKANMVTATSSSSWRRFVSVALGNGKGIIKTGDQIGVVEQWCWPSKSDMEQRSALARAAVIADVPAETFAGFKVRLGAASYKASDQAANWAGKLVGEFFDKDVTTKEGKREAKEMLAAWVDAGELEIVHIQDAYRRITPHIVPCGTT